MQSVKYSQKSFIAIALSDGFEKLNKLWRRLITRKDFLHLHALSGALFLLLAPILMGCLVLNSFNILNFNELRFLHSPLFVVVVVIGTINGFTAFPLMRFLNPYYHSGDRATQKIMKESFLAFGLCASFLAIWQFFRFSDYFPTVLSFTDYLVLIPIFILTFKGFYTSYRFLRTELKDDIITTVVFALGAYSSIFSILPLIPLLIGRQPWLERINAAYPLESFLYMKVAFATLLATNIINFGVTLLSKKVVGYRVVATLNIFPFLILAVGMSTIAQHHDQITINIFAGMF